MLRYFFSANGKQGLYLFRRVPVYVELGYSTFGEAYTEAYPIVKHPCRRTSKQFNVVPGCHPAPFGNECGSNLHIAGAIIAQSCSKHLIDPPTERRTLYGN